METVLKSQPAKILCQWQPSSLTSETVWKLVEVIIDNRVKKVVKSHDVLHGFAPKQGTSTAILEAKLQQELAAIPQQVLQQVHLDLEKAHNKLHRGQARQTLEGCGVGPRLLVCVD